MKITNNFLSKNSNNKSGFTIIELSLVVVIMIIIGGISAPVYQSFQLRSGLETAVRDSAHLLARAQALSQAGENDSGWGVHVENGRAILFLGADFPGRDQDYDEVSEFPTNLNVSGNQEILYAEVTGKPQISSPATLIFTAPSGETRNIIINTKGMLEY